MASIRTIIRCSGQIISKSNNLRHLHTTESLSRSAKVNLFDLNFDRRIKHDYKESIKYLESDTYKKIYNGHLVWKLYRRNHRAQLPRDSARDNCINDEGFIGTSYPCPICRDEYLVVHPENLKLIEQFIDPYTEDILPQKVHGVCKKQYRNIIISIIQARDMGLLTYQIPDRWYNYRDYFGDKAEK